MKIIAYDFDGTIYDGDSSIDFYKFCFKNKRSICKYWIKQVWYLMLYVLGIKTKTEMKEVFFEFLKEFDNPDDIIKKFWDIHFKKIKGWYLEKNHKNDLIISASPEFLLKIPCQKMKVKNLIASPVDLKTGKFLGENCYGNEKVRRLCEKYKDVIVEEMYTDSYADFPMLNYARKGYIVNKNKIILYHEYKPSFIKKTISTFFEPQFFRFIFVGCINAFLGVLFSFLYSFIIMNAKLAFVVGYLTSLIFSYLLNSYITFKDTKLSFIKYIKFCISYIPNFIIQLIFIYLFIDILNFYKLFAYIIATIIGVPITYLFLLVFTFKAGRRMTCEE